MLELQNKQASLSVTYAVSKYFSSILSEIIVAISLTALSVSSWLLVRTGKLSFEVAGEVTLLADSNIMFSWMHSSSAFFSFFLK